MPPSSCATARCVGAGRRRRGGYASSWQCCSVKRCGEQDACHATGHGWHSRRTREALRSAFKQLQPESAVLGLHAGSWQAQP